MEKRKKYFAKLREEERRRKPLTKTQRRNQMCTYLKNMAGYTHKQLKHKSFEEIQNAFDKQMQWISAFKAIDLESSKKRSGEELEEENVKKQKLEDDVEKAKLKECLEIVSDSDEAIRIEPLATRSPIVDWKIHSLRIVSCYIVERADGWTKMYKFFSEMLKEFDRRDLLDMYRLVKEKYKTKKLEAEALVFWGNFMTISFIVDGYSVHSHYHREKVYSYSKHTVKNDTWEATGPVWGCDKDHADSINNTNNVNASSSNLSNSTNNVNAASSNEINATSGRLSSELLDDPEMPKLEEIEHLSEDEDVGAEADMNNIDTLTIVRPIPTTRIHKDHPLDQVIRDLHSITQTRKMSKNLEEHGFVATVKQRTNHKDLQNCLFACFLSQEETKKMDVKSAFLYGKIKEEVYVCQPPGFEDPNFLDRVYKIEKELYGLHQAPRAWYETLSTYLLDNGFQTGKIDKTLFIRMDKDEFYGRTHFLLGIAIKTEERWDICQSIHNLPMETSKPLLKDGDGDEVDVHMYRLMIGSLMYLTSLRPDIMFVVCACARYQVTPKVSHLHAVKRIFRYLKGQPKLGLWYPKDSPFDLVAYTDSDYTRASLDRKSTKGRCQFLRCRLLSWQCKKQTIVANSITEAEYVAAASCLQLQALVDGKKIIITEASIRSDLQLNDEEGMDCFPNATIFEELTKMGTMESVIMCLATNQKFNFSKYIFESMVNNLDNAGSAILTDPHHTPTIIQPSTSQPQKKQRSRRPKRKDIEVPQPSGPTTNVADEAVYEERGGSLERDSTTATGLDA
ncbi:putative ribonuclease H-like domain-containing protein [Tanacetum coccineum]